MAVYFAKQLCGECRALGPGRRVYPAHRFSGRAQATVTGPRPDLGRAPPQRAPPLPRRPPGAVPRPPGEHPTAAQQGAFCFQELPDRGFPRQRALPLPPCPCARTHGVSTQRGPAGAGWGAVCLCVCSSAFTDPRGAPGESAGHGGRASAALPAPSSTLSGHCCCPSSARALPTDLQEGGARGRQRGTLMSETHSNGSPRLGWGTSLPLRCVPVTGIEPLTLQSSGLHSVH